jgi:hypothetical protein
VRELGLDLAVKEADLAASEEAHAIQVQERDNGFRKFNVRRLEAHAVSV